MHYNYRQINFEVMSDTSLCNQTIPELKDAVEHSIAAQTMIAEDEVVVVPATEPVETKYVVSGKRSFEAAKGYSRKKVAVLNYANNHFIGGAPYSAGAQEESLCRCSTLLPCLKAMSEPFYMRHRSMFVTGSMGHMGNDDIIYTPDVVVFKSDERTDPVYPKMMDRAEWYKVNVITCAAPEMNRMREWPDNYESVIRSRIKKILDVAARDGNEVVILGAWGCGAFRNSIEVVSKAFVELLKNYNFEIVEFALATRNYVGDSAFACALQEKC